MQFTVYIDDETSRQLSQAALKRGANRNSLILHAVQDWLQRETAQTEPARPVQRPELTVITNTQPPQPLKDQSVSYY